MMLSARISRSLYMTPVRTIVRWKTLPAITTANNTRTIRGCSVGAGLLFVSAPSRLLCKEKKISDAAQALQHAGTDTPESTLVLAIVCVGVAVALLVVYFSGTLGILGKVLTTLVGAYALTLVAFYFLQRKIIFPRPSQVVDPAVQSTVNVNVQESFIRGAGNVVTALFHPTSIKTARPPVIVYFHGNADQLGWGPAELSKMFTQKGMLFYAVEYPGYGLSDEGTPSESSITAAAEYGLQHLTSLDGHAINNSRVILMGQSIGAAPVIAMAAKGWGKAVILVSPFTSLHDMAAAVVPKWLIPPSLLPHILQDKFDNLSKTDQIKQPCLVLHGDADSIIPSHMGETVAKAIKHSTCKVIPGAGHNDIWLPCNPTEKLVLDFISEQH